MLILTKKDNSLRVFMRDIQGIILVANMCPVRSNNPSELHEKLPMCNFPMKRKFEIFYTGSLNGFQCLINRH